MAQNNNQSSLQNGEINLAEVFKKLFEAKYTIIIITLIFTISAFINDKQKIPIYQSTMLIEVGSYGEKDNILSKKNLIENPADLFSEFIKVTSIRKDLKVATKIKFSIIEQSIIKAETSSASIEENKLSLNKTLEYIVSRHDRILKTAIQKTKGNLITKINEINNELRYREKSLNQETIIKKSEINIAISNFNQHIQAIKKVIIEDENNYKLLQGSEELRLQAALKTPTLNQVIYNYKKELLEYVNLKEKKQLELELLSNEEMNITVFALLQKKRLLNSALDNLDNEIISQTRLISFDTIKIIQSSLKNIILAFFGGLFLSIGIVLFFNYIRSLKNKVNS